MSYAIMGITGQVGGAIASALLADGKKVRGIVRDLKRAQDWESQGVELVVADSHDASALAEAFRGTEGAFVMLPAEFDPKPGFPEAHTISAALAKAIDEARPAKVVVLSSIGAHQPRGLGLITNLHILEEALKPLSVPTVFLRPGWFMENSMWDVEPAKSGMITSYLHPLDKPFPMIATADIGRVAAGMLCEKWEGKRVVELEGPRRYSPNDIADAFSAALARPVVVQQVPRTDWELLFKSQGATNPTPRIEMLDGFNSDWISFEGPPALQLKGEVDLTTVIREIVARK
jgi:NAD(P)H dehydrogenase (quinone)